MRFKNILLLYKKCAYTIYFLERNIARRKQKSTFLRTELRRFEKSHDTHYNTLKTISRVLLANGVRFQECYRGRSINYSRYDLVITVGGDGTFLEASRNIKDQVIIGINSAPDHSVGRFCIASAEDFENIFERIQRGRFKLCKLHRLRLTFLESKQTVEALNDALVCHLNPAMLSRYYLQIKNVKEVQRSSGIWLSTPAGSSGAIKSAGGRLLNQYAKKLQYMPRELYPGKDGRYHLKGGVLDARGQIKITSLMRKGMIYIDGAHQKFPFDYGTPLKVSLSPNPIKTIKI